MPERGHRFRRREVLRGLGAGFSAGTVVSTAKAESVRTIRVPKIRDINGVIEWMKIPLPWYEQVNRAKAILREFRSQYSDVPGVVSTGLTKWDIMR